MRGAKGVRNAKCASGTKAGERGAKAGEKVQRLVRRYKDW